MRPGEGSAKDLQGRIRRTGPAGRRIAHAAGAAALVLNEKRPPPNLAEAVMCLYVVNVLAGGAGAVARLDLGRLPAGGLLAGLNGGLQAFALLVQHGLAALLQLVGLGAGIL